VSDSAEQHETVVSDNSARHRFEIAVGGSVAGFTVYRVESDKLHTLVHTEIGDAYAGQGLAGILVESTLRTMRRRGIEVRPQCPFVRAYIAKHPEFLDLVPASERARFGLPAAAE
jgi:predicted GNAT family acetyltransferase